VFPCNPEEQAAAARRRQGRDGQADPRHRRAQEGVDRPRADHAWWKRWPNALIGLCPGSPDQGHRDGRAARRPAPVRARLRPARGSRHRRGVDARALKRETEEQLGCALPESLAALTPSDGVHLYLLGRRRAADHQPRQPARPRRRARPRRLRDRAAERAQRRAAVPLASARADRRDRQGAGAAARGAARAPGAAPPSGPGNPPPAGNRSPAARRKAARKTSTMPCASTRWRRSTASCRRCAARRWGDRNAQLNESALQDRQLVAPARSRRRSRERCSSGVRGTIPAATTIEAAARRSTAAGQPDGATLAISARSRPMHAARERRGSHPPISLPPALPQSTWEGNPPKREARF
jgi:putative DNA primase/helicase